LVFFLINGTNLFGQFYNVKFKNIGIPEGLSNNHITNIVQDEYNYIWIGTERGLNRFDGTKVINLPIFKDSSYFLSSNHILDLEKNLDGGIWVVTKHGLILYKNDKFKKITTPKQDEFAITGAELINNQTWFFTSNGIYNYDKSDEELAKIEISPTSDFKYSFINNADIITALYEPGKNLLWVCTAKKGIYVKNIVSKTVNPYYLKKNEDQAANNIYIKKIILDNDGNIWFAGSEGLWRKPYDDTDCKKIYFPVSEFGTEIFDIEQDENGNIWCAVADRGLIILNSNGEIIEHFDAEDFNTSGLSSGFINEIFLDNQSNMWIGHQEAGIDYCVTHFSRKIAYYHNVINDEGFIYTKVKRIVALANKNILVAYESPDNPIVSQLSVISTENGNFFSKPSGIKHVNLNQVDLNITDIISFNELYAVTTYDHNYVFNPSLLYNNRSNINIYPSFGAYSDYVMFHYLHDDTYWILGQSLRTYDISERREKVYIPDPNLDRFIIDDNGLLWGAASYSGLVIIDLENKKTLAQFINDPLDESRISDNNINSIFKDSNGSIWIGTEFGLNKIVQNIDSLIHSANDSLHPGVFRDLSFHRFKIEDGLSSNAIKSILEDNRKRLWLATGNGISILDLNDYNIYQLGAREGVQNGSFIINSCEQTEDGNMFFGGEKGLNFFNPDNIDFETKQPVIHINELYINNSKVNVGTKLGKKIILNQDIEKTDEIELSYREKLLSIGFVALDFEHPKKIRYYHMLDGFDIDWIKSSGDNIARYTKLPAGEYIFRVKASTMNNQWTKEARLNVIINPPFWASWWFIVLASLALVFLILLYIRFRLSSLKRQKERLEEIVHQRTIDLEDANTGLQKQKEEILLQRDQLYELNQKIEKANAMKIRFFTNISHELRTPLTLILAPIEKLARTKGLLSAVHKKHLLIFKNAHRLHELINQLLQFRKIETGNLQLKAKRGDIIRYIKSISEPFIEYAKQSNLNFERIFESKKVYLWFDEDKLDKILANLLSNAFKYTEKGGKITLKVSSVNDNTISSDSSFDNHVRIDVSDTGIGIEQENLDKIFERFYECDESILKADGTGIGLSLTKSLVDLHKGKILVDSQPGIGSCFSVLLPRGEDFLEESEKIYSNETTFKHEPDSFKNSKYLDHDYLPELYEYDTNKETILIVDDNTDLCHFIQDLLHDEYNIEIAHNGQEAYELLKNDDRISLVISDIMMPVMDGLTFCQKIKNDISTSHLPVILLTAKHGEDSELQGLKTGADDYITKPFNEDLLKAKLRNIFSFREKLKIEYANQINIEPSDITTTSRDKEFVTQAIKVVEENMSEPEFDIKTFASTMAMSSSTLLRKIKALTGESSDRFIRTLRLKRAAQLLQKSQFLVTEICYEVGFSSQKHFSTTFKKHYGLSPTEYKNKYSEFD
jgi:signal transduction histidine kinase/DNA-binding response OmpR family regulator/ligand-binding sensor domain-containing protein